MDLLANVGALLADTRTLLTRLQDGEDADSAAAGHDAEDGDDAHGGFFAGGGADGNAPGGRPSPGAPHGGVAAGTAGAAEDDVAVDEVYEFQVGLKLPFALQGQFCHLGSIARKPFPRIEYGKPTGCWEWWRCCPLS